MFRRNRKATDATMTVRAVTVDGVTGAAKRIMEAFDDRGAENAAKALLYVGIGLGAAAMADEIVLGPASEEELSMMRRLADKVAMVVMMSRRVDL